MKNRGVVFNDLLMKLERRDVDDVDICLDGPEDAGNLVVLPLFKVTHRQPFELFHGVGTYVDLKAIRSLNYIPILRKIFLQLSMSLQLSINCLQHLLSGSFSLERSSPVSLNYKDLTKK